MRLVATVRRASRRCSCYSCIVEQDVSCVIELHSPSRDKDTRAAAIFPYSHTPEAGFAATRWLLLCPAALGANGRTPGKNFVDKSARTAAFCL